MILRSFDGQVVVRRWSLKSTTKMFVKFTGKHQDSPALHLCLQKDAFRGVFLWILKFLEKLFCKMREYDYVTHLTLTCSRSTIETGKRCERRQWRRSGVFIINFEHISHLFLVFLFFDFEQVTVRWILLFVYYKNGILSLLISEYSLFPVIQIALLNWFHVFKSFLCKIIQVNKEMVQ